MNDDECVPSSPVTKLIDLDIIIIRCHACMDSGWVLDCVPNKEPLILDLIPCLVPDCEKSGREFELLSLPPGLRIVARRPDTSEIMSVHR